MFSRAENTCDKNDSATYSTQRFLQQRLLFIFFFNIKLLMWRFYVKKSYSESSSTGLILVLKYLLCTTDDNI